MTQTLGCICWASLLVLNATLAGAGQVADSSSTVTVTATIEALDKANRTITLKRPTGDSVEIKAPEQMEGFNSLRVGDQVTATYFQALALNLRKSGDPAPAGIPTTTVRKDRTPGSESRRQQTFIVTVEAIDPKAPSVTVKTPQGRVVSLAVTDAKQLQNIKVGDTVDATYYESLLVKVVRPPK